MEIQLTLLHFTITLLEKKKKSACDGLFNKKQRQIYPQVSRGGSRKDS